MGVLDRFRLSLDVVIRHCDERDLPLLEWLGSFSSHRAFMWEQFERHLHGANVMLVADLAGYPVGQAWVDLERYADVGGALVWAVRVIDPLRGKGIGTRLIHATEAVAIDAGRAFVELGVEKENERARRLYERAGYVQVGEEACDERYVAPDGGVWHHTYDQIVLRRPLGGGSPTRA